MLLIAVYCSVLLRLHVLIIIMEEHSTSYSHIEPLPCPQSLFSGSKKVGAKRAVRLPAHEKRGTGDEANSTPAAVGGVAYDVPSVPLWRKGPWDVNIFLFPWPQYGLPWKHGNIAPLGCSDTPQFLQCYRYYST